MILKFTIDNARAPAVLAAILLVEPRLPEDHADYIEDETDVQWAHRVMQKRVDRMIASILKRANRVTAKAEGRFETGMVGPDAPVDPDDPDDPGPAG